MVSLITFSKIIIIDNDCPVIIYEIYFVRCNVNFNSGSVCPQELSSASSHLLRNRRECDAMDYSDTSRVLMELPPVVFLPIDNYYSSSQSDLFPNRYLATKGSCELTPSYGRCPDDLHVILPTYPSGNE